MNILLVDSDPQTISSLQSALASLPDASVKTASSGEAALALAEEWGGVDWLVTEVFLDPMNGFTLRNKLANRVPGMKCIFLSTYDLTAYLEHTEGSSTLKKPVPPAELLDLIGKRTQAVEISPVIAVVESTLAPALETSPPAPAEIPVATAIEPPSEVPFVIATEKTIPAPKVAARVSSPLIPKAQPAFAPPPVLSAPRAVSGPKLSSPPQVLPKVASPRVTGVPAPKAMAPIRPAPGPRAVAVPKAVVVPKAAAVPATPRKADDLSGQTVGSYKIVRKMADGKWGPTYEAIQTTMNRSVAMQILAPESERDPEAKKQFIANASAKANVQHPLILAVYEAGETDGHCFYTHEYVDGSHFGEMAAQGRTIDEPSALQTVKAVAEGLSHLSNHKIPHAALSASDLYFGRDKRPRMGNLAVHFDEQPGLEKEMSTVAQIVSSVLPGGRAVDTGLQEMLMRMRKPGPGGFGSWPALLQTVKALEPKVVPADVYKISAQDEAAIRAVEEAKKRQRRQVLFSALGALSLVALSAFTVWSVFFKSNEKNLDIMVPIPAGEFVFQDGQKQVLPAFYIGKYEVTIGQYAKFLSFLSKHPTTEFDHAKQPPGKSHIPSGANWKTYYERAKWGKPARFVPIDLNCPVFNVDYWDAYAYAKWRGARLPTEEEWEKAGRGTDGRLYPWGNTPGPNKANGSGDYMPNPGPGLQPKNDGYTWWSPVDALSTDKSPFGIIGMAANLSEWTDTWANGKPVIRGGNFRNEDMKITRRVIEADPETFTESLGFRIASDKELPAK